MKSQYKVFWILQFEVCGFLFVRNEMTEEFVPHLPFREKRGFVQLGACAVFRVREGPS